MNSIRAAFYARVSSEQQAAAHTIESQLSALSERAHADGLLVPQERQFLDDGYSGATLVRPAMYRLRDLEAVGGVDRILSGASTAFMSTHLIGWPATTPTKSCSSMSGVAPVSKSSS